MEKNTNHVLDIHTHQSAYSINAASIVNYPLLGSAPPHLPGGPHEYYSAGLHPWELTEDNANQQLQLLETLAGQKQLVAVGESGLDKLAQAPMELQVKMFKEQVNVSETHKLPLIIHCVKAMDELLAVKKALHALQPWIWHGFRGTPEQALQLLGKGFYLSFGARFSAASVASVPADRLFVETDAATVDIEHILGQVAQARGVEVDILRNRIGENVQKVFFTN